MTMPVLQVLERIYAVRGRLSKDPRLLKLTITLLVVIPLLGTLYALAAFSWYRGDARDLILFAVFFVLTAFGVTVGYHRLLTHRSFECHPVLKAILLGLGCFALEGSPLQWAATHIKHHAHADKDGDPHSPMEGLFHAHVGWLMRPESYADPAVYAPHLTRDRIVLFFDRTYLFWTTLSFVLPFALGGWSGLLWGGLVRVFFGHHVTWSVNSICHLFGSRPFRTTDASANNWIVAVLGFGEGWHNNHHAFPQSAVHGLTPWQMDLSALLIRVFARLRLAWDVHVPSPDLIAMKRAEHVAVPVHPQPTK